MTKKLLVQIKNEWRNNLWLALELLVVSVVMWFVVDYLYTRTAIWGIERSGFFNGRGKWAKGFENQRV